MPGQKRYNWIEEYVKTSEKARIYGYKAYALDIPNNAGKIVDSYPAIIPSKLDEVTVNDYVDGWILEFNDPINPWIVTAEIEGYSPLNDDNVYRPELVIVKVGDDVQTAYTYILTPRYKQIVKKAPLITDWAEYIKDKK